MKFNTTYESNDTLFEVIKNIDFIRNEVIAFFKKKFNLTYIDLPLFAEEGNDKLLSIEHVTRKISFDYSKDFNIGTFFLTITNALRDKMMKINFKKNHGLYTYSATVLRDIEENLNRSIQRNELVFQVVSKNSTMEKLNNLSQEIYDFFYKLADIFESDRGIRNIYPIFAEYISTQQMEYQMPRDSFADRENEFINQKKAIILKAPGSIMKSGSIHTYIDPTIYFTEEFNQFILQDRTNMTALKVGSIAYLTNGPKMLRQLKRYKKFNHSINEFTKNSIASTKSIMEIRINIPRLAMALLGKGHIAETQPGVINSEVKNIKNKYGVKII